MIDKGTGLQSVLFCHDEPNMLCYVEQEYYQDPCAIYEYMQRLSCISYMMVQFEKELKTVNTADPKSKETLEHVRDTMLTYYIQAKTSMENIPHIKIEPIEEK